MKRSRSPELNQEDRAWRKNDRANTECSTREGLDEAGIGGEFSTRYVVHRCSAATQRFATRAAQQFLVLLMVSRGLTVEPSTLRVVIRYTSRSTRLEVSLCLVCSLIDWFIIIVAPQEGTRSKGKHREGSSGAAANVSKCKL